MAIMPIACKVESMVTYCYRTEDGDILERVFQMGKAPEAITFYPKELGKQKEVAVRDYGAEGVTGTVVGTDNPTRRSKPKRPWPMPPCVASGVHPSQAQELRDHLAERGCPTEVTPGGDPIYTSAAHQDKALKIRGFRNKKSFG